MIANAATGIGFSGAPTSVRLPSRFSIPSSALMSCSADTQSRMKSKLNACRAIWFASLRKHHLIGSQPQCILLLLWRRCKHNRMRAQRMRKLHTHVPQATQSHYAHLLAFTSLPSGASANTS